MHRACCLMIALALPWPATAYRLAGGRWPAHTQPVVWSLDVDATRLTGRGADAASLRDSVTDAFAAWTRVSRAAVHLAPPAELDPSVSRLARDGLNAVSWAEAEDVQPWGFGSGALAVTVPIVEGDRLVEADVAFNARDYRWGLGRAGAAACEGEVDVRAVALHEGGHFFGLAHSCELVELGTEACEGVGDSVMTAAYGLEPRAELGRDDVDGIRALYPGPAGARDTVCFAADDCAAGLGCLGGRCADEPASTEPLLCRPCAGDRDCEGAPCVRGEGHAYCSRGCAREAPCEAGFTCVGLVEGRGVPCAGDGCFCVPDAGRCERVVPCGSCGGERGGCGAVVGCPAPLGYVTDGSALGRCVDPAASADAGDGTTPNEKPPEPCGCGPAGFSWWGLCALASRRRRR